MNIPFSMRLLYVHSYCSLVWNHVASHRLKMNGSRGVVEGDLVCDSGYSEATTEQGKSIKTLEPFFEKLVRYMINILFVSSAIAMIIKTATLKRFLVKLLICLSIYKGLANCRCSLVEQSVETQFFKLCTYL